MRNLRARGAVRRADWGFRGTRFDAFCLRASQSIKNQMCLTLAGRAAFIIRLIMLRSATATKQLGDSVRRCQKTESGAATAPRHEERDWGRPPAACGESTDAPPHDMCVAARSSTSGVVGGVAHQRLERRTMHRQRERVRRECGARANRERRRRRGSCGTGTSWIENGSSSERTLHQNESRTSKMGKQRAAEQVEILAALTLSIGSTRDCITSG